ncbi:DUF1294 domain-containing protein [Chryseobacterium sp.]|uniref:DUF1294 domain-containing protein n=1 Tax=Chryseobacterium sp. TaxID=1871047 RepID=UPI00388F5972
MMLIFLLITSILTFFIFGLDKYYATHHKRRISEFLLLLFTFFGGTIGAILGMLIFRHKTAKRSFIIKMGIIIFSQILIIYCMRNIVL